MLGGDGLGLNVESLRWLILGRGKISPAKLPPLHDGPLEMVGPH